MTNRGIIWSLVFFACLTWMANDCYGHEYNDSDEEAINYNGLWCLLIVLGGSLILVAVPVIIDKYGDGEDYEYYM